MSIKREETVKSYKAIIKRSEHNTELHKVIKSALGNIHMALLNLQIEGSREVINKATISIIGKHIDESCNALRSMLTDNDKELDSFQNTMNTLKDALNITEEEIKVNDFKNPKIMVYDIK